MTGSAASASPTGVDTAERLLTELRAEIGRADTKASVLIGALGVCAGVVLSSRWSTIPPDGPGRFLGLAGGLAWILALGFLLFATAPRYRPSRWRPGHPLTYFLDIHRAAASGLLADALRGTEENPLAGLLIALKDTSDIVAAKHGCIRAGLACFVLGAATLLGSALAGG